jgi:hypothetical protein
MYIGSRKMPPKTDNSDGNSPLTPRLHLPSFFSANLLKLALSSFVGREKDEESIGC